MSISENLSECPFVIAVLILKLYNQNILIYNFYYLKRQHYIILTI